MVGDIRETEEFYATGLGRVTARILRQHLLEIWPDCAGMNLLGLGYAGPYLQLWRPQAARCIALMPQQFGVSAWPPGRAGLACTAEDDALPFADLSFDRILLIHGLEHAENARRHLRETWRLLKDDGRLIAIVPNRRGLWAYAEGKPFGHGQPYSQGQLANMLRQLLFNVETQQAALFLPPIDWGPLTRQAQGWERAGLALAPQFAGLTIAEATKDLHGVMPVHRRAKLRRVLVDLGV